MWSVDYFKDEFKLSILEDNPKPSIRVISLGAGVQSSTMMFLAFDGVIKDVDAAIFADTGNEPKAVYEYLDLLKKKVGSKIPIYVVSKGNIYDDAIADKVPGTTKGFPTMPLFIRNSKGGRSMGMRQCTNDYKIQPLYKKIRELVGVKSMKNKSAEILMGISYDEQQRAKTPRLQWPVHVYPYLNAEITRQDCLEYYDSKDLGTPPRSACIVCPYKTDKEWYETKKNQDEWQMAVDFDEKVRNINDKENYVHPSLKPLKDFPYDDSKLKEYVPSLSMDECEGMCGL